MGHVLRDQGDCSIKVRYHSAGKVLASVALRGEIHVLGACLEAGNHLVGDFFCGIEFGIGDGLACDFGLLLLVDGTDLNVSGGGGCNAVRCGHADRYRFSGFDRGGDDLRSIRAAAGGELLGGLKFGVAYRRLRLRGSGSS